MEAGACQRLLRQFFRHRGWLGKRLTVLIDSLPVCFAFRNGRSSSGGLMGPLRAIGAMLLATGAKLHAAYVPSECNPADEPSRGLLRRGRGSAIVERGIAYRSRASVLGAKRNAHKRGSGSNQMLHPFSQVQARFLRASPESSRRKCL